MDGKAFLEALDQIEAEKGISKQSIIDALKVAIRKAYIREIEAEDDAEVTVEITESEIKMFITKTVVDEVDLDYLDISLADAKKYKKTAKVGDKIDIEVDVNSLKRITAMVVKSILRQKLAEAEKQSLYEANKDKINEMITGVVDRCDDRGVYVNVGRTSVYLSRRDLIGDETFEPGESIRMFVANVSNNEKGSMIKVTRSDAGFLRRLFEEEVHEIYDGTVIIKALAREAGVRSKLAVYSNDPNVDCVGACIGVNGTAIKRIVEQLGNSRDKEKIDIIQYTPNEALYIIDAIRPATVTYIHMDPVAEDGKKKAIVIVQDDQLSLAIGKKGANVRVACRLTGWSIDVHEEREMANFEGVEFKSVEEIREEDKERVKKETYERYLAQVKASAKEEVKPEVTLSAGVEKSKPQQILDEDIKDVKPAKEEAKVAEKKVEEEVKPVEETKTVKTTTTLESLEALLSSDKKKESFKATQKTSKRPHNITDEEQPHKEEEKPVEEKKVTPKMDIYTQEELEDFENEYMDEDINNIDDEDIDYDEYDQYYDDDDK
ncbi:MAG: transcription termination factor NusA [Bacilli bacterium]|nr:transcription termination factor NusA [Bacilli bacterium]